ncbi:class I SAM-dependent methyltransferase [Eggerthellaceae bacterium zg-997]|nr:class I SAM-dependent methyltransferase [Eggerthellaceae bacterium zg-997]
MRPSNFTGASQTAKPTNRSAIRCDDSADAQGAPASDHGCDDDSLEARNLRYWTRRSESYSAQNANELRSWRAGVWTRELEGEIGAGLPASARVLDVGCGPGLFSVLLARRGYRVWGIDATPAMLRQAESNTRGIEPAVTLVQMNAQRLDFADDSFDVVVTRNLTWNLPHPAKAYREWCRVLKPGGVLVNFDANWYGYLYESPEHAARVREAVGSRGIDGSVLWTDVTTMEQIAQEVPLSGIERPQWDIAILDDLGMSVRVDVTVGQRVWTDDERAHFAATPLFKVVARKPLR